MAVSDVIARTSLAGIEIPLVSWLVLLAQSFICISSGVCLVIIVPETSFSYNAHFSLSLPSITIDTFPTFLIGPNGSGKTTLLKILGGFFKVSPPVKVKWQGTLRETRPIYFAYMPAKPTYDPNFTVRNYLMLSGNKRQLETIAKELELTKWLGRRMGTLSSGWLQRVFIARILLQDTPYVLMDEPTSFLDLKRERISLRAYLGTRETFCDYALKF